MFINFATEHYEEDTNVAMVTDSPSDENSTQLDHMQHDDDEPLIELHQQPPVAADDFILSI